MIITASGSCELCDQSFGLYDSVQSTNVQCDQCGKDYRICSKCKSERDCHCGGHFRNTFDNNPNLLH